MTNLLAATSIPLAPSGGFKGFGKFGLEGFSSSSAPVLFSVFLSRTIGVITIVAFIWFLFTIITGAISIIGAGSDKQALENAKKRITMGLVGLTVTIAAIFIVRFAGAFLGIENILDPVTLIEQITK